MAPPQTVAGAPPFGRPARSFNSQTNCGGGDTGGVRAACYISGVLAFHIGPVMRPISVPCASVLVIALIIGLPVTAIAHHTYVTKYDSAKKVKLSGTVSSVRFSNPHIFFTLNTAKGSWTVETESIPVVQKKGLTASLLKDGAKVTVSGWPARNGSAAMGLSTISFAGGVSLSIRGTAR